MGATQMKKPDVGAKGAPFYYKAMYYGQPGAGKTWLSASAQGVIGNCLMISCAGNPISLRKQEQLPDIIEATQLADFNAIYDFFQKKQPKDHPLLTAANSLGIELHPPYDGLIVDGLTEVQRQVFHVVLPGTDAPPGTAIPTLERQHFNKILGTMLNWANKFIHLDVHVILTSLEAEKQDGTSGSMFYRPLIWGQAEGETSGYVYQVVRLVPIEQMDVALVKNIPELKDPSARCVAMFRANSRQYAKDQYNTGLTYLVNPTMKTIWERILAAQ